MFFVLSTGRSGSTTIARALSQVPGVLCKHEPTPTLIEEAKEYVEGRMPRDQIVALLRETRVPPGGDLCYGESNYTLAFLADALVEAFRRAHYIWLVRNGLNVVASFEHRRTYRGMQNIHGQNMPCGDKVGDMSAERWQAMTPFARCCWRWSWTNGRIRQVLERADARRFYVRLEDLQDRFDELAGFLGIRSPAAPKVPVANAARSAVTRFRYWDSGQRRSFKEICGPLMDDLYPGWKDLFVFGRGQRLRNELLAQLSYRRATGRALRHVGRLVLPPAVRGPFRRLFAGRGLLDYADA